MSGATNVLRALASIGIAVAEFFRRKRAEQVTIPDGDQAKRDARTEWEKRIRERWGK